MTFYIGAQVELPIIPFDEDKPTFHTTPLSEDERSIYKHISLPYALYFGSNQGCGCGFRHAILDNGKWLCVETEEETLTEREVVQKNHEELYNYIKGLIIDNSLIQIYGCWDGDTNEDSESVEVINVEHLIDTNFYFKERGFYRIKTHG